MIVNEVNVAEFRIKGIKQRKPSLAARLCINSELSGPDEGIIIPNECSRDEAWVITNIKMPESTIEWLERPVKAPATSTVAMLLLLPREK